MSFSIRKAVPADLAAITAIYREAVLNRVASYEVTPPSADEMARRFGAVVDKAYPYIAAEAPDGTLLGYAYASAFRTRPAYRWIVEDSIYLSPAARGRGVGKALLLALIERCEALGFRQIIAVIGGGHPASVGMHRACGFADSGIIRGAGFKHGSWLDTVLMQKSLGDGTTTDPDLAAYPGTLFQP